MMLPSLPLDSNIQIHTCKNGIEYKGMIFISNNINSTPFTYKELWFCAHHESLESPESPETSENSEMPPLRGQKVSNVNMHLAKLMQTKEKLGCTYDKNIENLLNKSIPKMYVI